MYNVILFAGTTEGYEIAKFLQSHSISTCACVATEYGTHSLQEDENLTVLPGRMDQPEMESFFQKEQPSLVIDATHPYAAVVTANIRQACIASDTSYLRVLRESGDAGEAVYVENAKAAAAYLSKTEGNVLLTTGSKELPFFTSIPDYKERLYARVLSLPKVMQDCASLGFEGKHLIGMQGPFSKELNEAMLRQYRCRYLVTKNTGRAGGFQEKIEAALSCHVTSVIIGRPLKEEGISLPACRKLLAERFGFSLKPQITLLGIGVGNPKNLTLEGQEAVAASDLIIGAKRMADSIRLPHHKVHYAYRSEEILSYIEKHKEYSRILIALSGDVGFYSGAKGLLERLPKETQVICGISSMVYFMSKIGLSWDDARIVSAHGKYRNLVADIKEHPKVFAILGASDGVSLLAKKLCQYGMGDVTLWVGEKLSYPEELIFQKKARELTEYEGDPLSVLCAINEHTMKPYVTHGIPDRAFLRGNAPMTKEEVRTVSLSKLQLQSDSVIYDVGAGTGSVSIEMALRASQGTVYAIEKKEDALKLLQQNKEHFGVDNLVIVPGSAPEAMVPLCPPTHAFIGGSSGNLQQIVALLLEKNSQVRIVINCITLETVSEALNAIRTFAFDETDIVSLTAARSKGIGHYHMMMGENPIYIITCQRRSQ